MAFRAALLEVPAIDRDAWLDRVLGLGETPDDGPDVVVDVGGGLGRAAALLHLLTGAAVVGLEIQPRLVLGWRNLAARLMVEKIYRSGPCAPSFVASSNSPIA